MREGGIGGGRAGGMGAGGGGWEGQRDCGSRRATLGQRSCGGNICHPPGRLKGRGEAHVGPGSGESTCSLPSTNARGVSSLLNYARAYAHVARAVWMADAQRARAASRHLPKTASPVPMFGLASAPCRILYTQLQGQPGHARLASDCTLGGESCRSSSLPSCDTQPTQPYLQRPRRRSEQQHRSA